MGLIRIYKNKRLIDLDPVALKCEGGQLGDNNMYCVSFEKDNEPYYQDCLGDVVLFKEYDNLQDMFNAYRQYNRQIDVLHRGYRKEELDILSCQTVFDDEKVCAYLYNHYDKYNLVAHLRHWNLGNVTCDDDFKNPLAVIYGKGQVITHPNELYYLKKKKLISDEFIDRCNYIIETLGGKNSPLL